MKNNTHSPSVIYALQFFKSCQIAPKCSARKKQIGQIKYFVYNENDPLLAQWIISL